MDEPEIEQDPRHESLLDRLRGTGVGVEDPNIVGDVGPTDIPPGRDPGTEGSLFADPPVPLDPSEDPGAAGPVDSLEPPDLLAP
ncbi:MAG: hypothetical protein M3066_01135 [Actinomycetota bacterium]|nr:hypothetical protein [Actinomycetota bacterium]